jgi:hypothetical protein
MYEVGVKVDLYFIPDPYPTFQDLFRIRRGSMSSEKKWRSQFSKQQLYPRFLKHFSVGVFLMAKHHDRFDRNFL